MIYESGLFMDDDIPFKPPCIYLTKWMVSFMENPSLKWMMKWGGPILGNLQIP